MELARMYLRHSEYVIASHLYGRRRGLRNEGGLAWRDRGRVRGSGHVLGHQSRTNASTVAAVYYHHYNRCGL